MNENNEIKSCRVLIVEDDAMLAMRLEDILVEMGCEVVCTASRLDGARRACAAAAFDVAVLDLNLRGESALPVAEALQVRGRPFVIATGYDDSILTESLRAAPVLRKPYGRGDLEVALWDALHSNPARPAVQ